MKISSTGERFKARVGSLSGNRALTPANDKSGGNNCMIKYNSDTENSSEPSKPDGNSAESVETELNITEFLQMNLIYLIKHSPGRKLKLPNIQ